MRLSGTLVYHNLFPQSIGDCNSVTLLIVGLVLSIGTLLWFLICLLILCELILQSFDYTLEFEC